MKNPRLFPIEKPSKNVLENPNTIRENSNEKIVRRIQRIEKITRYSSLN